MRSGKEYLGRAGGSGRYERLLIGVSYWPVVRSAEGPGIGTAPEDPHSPTISFPIVSPRAGHDEGTYELCMTRVERQSLLGGVQHDQIRQLDLDPVCLYHQLSPIQPSAINTACYRGMSRRTPVPTAPSLFCVRALTVPLIWTTDSNGKDAISAAKPAWRHTTCTAPEASRRDIKCRFALARLLISSTESSQASPVEGVWWAETWDSSGPEGYSQEGRCSPVRSYPASQYDLLTLYIGREVSEGCMCQSRSRS